MVGAACVTGRLGGYISFVQQKGHGVSKNFSLGKERRNDHDPKKE
jgi:hypothetical protein